MATRVTPSKGGIKITYETSSNPAPRVNNDFDYPQITTKANVLVLTLEDVPQQGKKGIRVTATVESLAGKDPWTIRWKCTPKDSSGQASTGEQPITWPINWLYKDAQANCNYEFWLHRAGPRPCDWASVVLSGGTPADDTLKQLEQMASDGWFSAGSEKAKAQSDWSIACLTLETKITQAASIFSNTLYDTGTGRSISLECEDLWKAYLQLDAVKASWADASTSTELTPFTAMSPGAGKSVYQRWVEWFAALADLEAAISFRLHAPTLSYVINCNHVEAIYDYAVDPVTGTMYGGPPEDPTNNWTYAQYMAFSGGHPPIVGQAVAVASWWYGSKYISIIADRTDVSLFTVEYASDSSHYRLKELPGFSNYSQTCRLGDTFPMTDGSTAVLGKSTTEYGQDPYLNGGQPFYRTMWYVNKLTTAGNVISTLGGVYVPTTSAVTVSATGALDINRTVLANIVANMTPGSAAGAGSVVGLDDGSSTSTETGTVDAGSPSSTDSDLTLDGGTPISVDTDVLDLGGGGGVTPDPVVTGSATVQITAYSIKAHGSPASETSVPWLPSSQMSYSSRQYDETSPDPSGVYVSLDIYSQDGTTTKYGTVTLAPAAPASAKTWQLTLAPGTYRAVQAGSFNYWYGGNGGYHDEWKTLVMPYPEFTLHDGDTLTLTATFYA